MGFSCLPRCTTLHHHQLWNLGEKTIVTKIPDVSAVVGPMFLSSLHHVAPICVSWAENKTFMSKLKYRMFLLRLQSWAECFNTTRGILTSFIHQLLSILTKLMFQEPTICRPSLCFDLKPSAHFKHIHDFMFVTSRSNSCHRHSGSVLFNQPQALNTLNSVFMIFWRRYTTNSCASHADPVTT